MLRYQGNTFKCVKEIFHIFLIDMKLQIKLITKIVKAMILSSNAQYIHMC